MTKPLAHISPLDHRGEKRIKVDLPYQKDAIERIKKVTGRKWSRTNNCWHVPYSKEVFRELKEHFEVRVSEDIPLSEIPSPTDPPFPSGEFIKEGQPQKAVTGNLMVVEKENDEWLKVYVPFDKKGWIEAVKNVPVENGTRKKNIGKCRM